MRDKKIGFLGPQGTFSEIALNQFLAGGLDSWPEMIAASSIPQLFDWLRDDKVNEIWVPVENSNEGVVTDTIDGFMEQLIEKNEIYIIDEYKFNVELALLGHPEFIGKGSPKSDHIKIWSHENPLRQCRTYLHEQYTNAALVTKNSTAAAAEEWKKLPESEKKRTAIVGHFLLNDRYHMGVIDPFVQGKKINQTIFNLLSKKKNENESKHEKTTIIFAIEDKPGALVNILKEFSPGEESGNNINLSRIHPRPTKTADEIIKLGQYAFFIELLVNGNKKEVSAALTRVKEKASFYKCLGFYPSSRSYHEEP